MELGSNKPPLGVGVYFASRSFLWRFSLSVSQRLASSPAPARSPCCPTRRPPRRRRPRILRQRRPIQRRPTRPPRTLRRQPTRRPPTPPRPPRRQRRRHDDRDHPDRLRAADDRERQGRLPAGREWSRSTGSNWAAGEAVHLFVNDDDRARPGPTTQTSRPTQNGGFTQSVPTADVIRRPVLREGDGGQRRRRHCEFHGRQRHGGEPSTSAQTRPPASRLPRLSTWATRCALIRTRRRSPETESATTSSNGSIQARPSSPP